MRQPLQVLIAALMLAVIAAACYVATASANASPEIASSFRDGKVIRYEELQGERIYAYIGLLQ